jgi:nucleoside phosphorylase
VELLSLIGDVALKDGKPVVHAHAVIGKKDGTAHGGHLLEAHIRPTCEVILTGIIFGSSDERSYGEYMVAWAVLYHHFKETASIRMPHNRPSRKFMRSSATNSSIAAGAIPGVSIAFTLGRRTDM